MAYIDKELFKQDIKMRYCNNCARPNEIKCRACHIDDMLSEIEDAPTADVAEVKHGSWTFARSERKVVCSCCETPAPFDKKVGYHTLWRSPHCHNCGAKMDAERNDEDGNR